MTSKQLAPYPLRMPVELREALTQIADSNGRSLNQEVVDRLEKSLRPPQLLPRGLREIVDAAAGDATTSLEERTLKLVLEGIRAEAYRRSVEDRESAERYRNVAIYQLIASTADRFAELVQYLGKIAAVDPEKVAAIERDSEALSRCLRQLDIQRVTKG